MTKSESPKEVDVISGESYIDTSVFMGYDSLDEAIADYKFTSQAEALARMLCRENIFLSGPAGSGKSHLVKKFIQIMGETFGENVHIAVTASTGAAASLIGGRTIHSWSGIRIGTEVKRVPENVKNTDVLIIDEISMLHAYYLDLVDKVCRRAKRSNEPFGGIQVIFMGDFKQLPPVPNKELPSEFDQRFVVFSDAWKEADIKSCYLDKTMRAKDPKLQKLLSDLENGTVDQSTVNLLKTRKLGRVQPDPNKAYTQLHTFNKQVDSINQEELSKNPNPEHRYKRSIHPISPDKKAVEEMSKSITYPEEVVLKEGAKVMITKNAEYATVSKRTLTNFQQPIFVANGEIGKVVKIVKHGETDDYSLLGAVLVQLNNGTVIAVKTKAEVKSKYTVVDRKPDTKEPITERTDILTVSYMPLKLAYAISVHKSQGMSLSAVYCDLSKCFTAGLGYVALSRISSLDDLIVVDFNKKTFMMNPDSMKISKSLKNSAKKLRKHFLDNKDDYEMVLTVPFTRTIYWSDKI